MDRAEMIEGVRKVGSLRARKQGEVWVIDEIVTPQGYYITWPICYATRERAEEVIAQFLRDRAK